MAILLLGEDAGTGEKVLLDFSKTVNSNGAIWGSSGVGKSTMMKAIIANSSQKGLVSIVFDVHGDIFPDSPLVSSIKISESSEFGLEPFKISDDLEFGGVNKAIKQFIYALEVVTGKIGERQRPVLVRLIEELFWKNGFYVRNPKTWSLHYDPWEDRPYRKKYPTFNDLIRFIESKRKAIFMSTDSSTISALESFISKSKRVQVGRKEQEVKGEVLIEMKRQALEAYESFLSSEMDEVAIDDYLRYTNEATMTALLDRLETLQKTGLFKEQPIVFDLSKKVHRYDIKALNVDEQKIFIQLTLEKLFAEARKRNDSTLKGLIWIDEAKNYIDARKSDIVTKCFTEIRKFGWGIWVAGQRSEHFNEDIITNAACKLILGVDTTAQKKLASRLDLDLKFVQRIKPQSTMMVEIKRSKERGKFIEVRF